jgi:hypothetical protein
MKALVLSPSLCSALDVQARVFEHPWSILVLSELRPLLSGREAISGTSLSNKLMILMRQACSTRDGLFECFRLTPYQIQYTSRDRRYRVTIQQRENAEGVIMVWQIYTRLAGRNSFSFLVSNEGWTLQKEQVSDEAMENLALLGEAGGELIGYFALHNLIPSSSLFNQAVEAHMGQVRAKREAVAQAAGA